MEIEAIILHIVPYKDKDAIVSALSVKGIISFLARGIMDIKSKNASLIMLYNHVLIDLNDKYDGKSLSLKNGKVIDSASRFYGDIEKMLTLSFAGELAYKSVDEENAEKLFSMFLLLQQSLNGLKKCSTVRLVFLAHCIKLLGISPNVSSCVNCGSKKKIASLSLKKGGYICADCFTHDLVNHSADYLKVVRYIFEAPYDVAINADLKEESTRVLLKDLVNHLNEELSIVVNSYKLIKQTSLE